MKIQVNKWIIDDIPVYKIINVEKCCDKLINSKNTSINSQYDDYYYETNDYDYSVKLIRIEEDNDIGDNIFYEKINFCPFCGNPIIIEIINEINKTAEYNILNNKRESLWRKCCKTDSKKKEGILKQQVRELDIELNNMLISDDFTKNEEEF